jgi:hypothetical protein
MVLLVGPALIGLLALANSALAIPPPFFGKHTSTLQRTTPTTVATHSTRATSAPASASTGLISITDSEIEAAPIIDLPPKNSSLKTISGAPLSGVLAARPDLQAKINAQPAIAQALNKTLSKRATPDPIVKHAISLFVIAELIFDVDSWGCW